MSGIIKGKAFVLGDDIDTDQIIPANHLVYNLDDPEERKMYGAYALSGIPKEKSGLPAGNISFLITGEYQSQYTIVIGGKNFGCGSSREHAPVALNMAGVKAIVAGSYARIFYRNAVDGGYIVPYESEIDISKEIHTGDLIEINREKSMLINLTQNKSYQLKPLGDIADIVDAGGIFAFAHKQGITKSK